MMPGVVMKQMILLLILALFLAFLLAPGAEVLSAEPMQASYKLDLTQPDSGEIAVALEMETASQPLMLELPDSYGNGLAAGLSSHIVEEKAVDASGQELPVRRDGDIWYIDYSGRITFSYKVKVSGYEAGTAYLDSLADSGNPWPYFPSLAGDLAYLPGYAVFVRPDTPEGVRPNLELKIPAGWQQALPWPEQPADMEELLENPIFAGDLSLYEQGSLVLAIPAAASAASGGALAEYAGKAQTLLEKSESLLGGLDLPEGHRLLLALLFLGEGETLQKLYYPSDPFSASVVLSAPSGNDPLSDSTIEATAKGMASLLLAKELFVGADTKWISEGSAWYLQDFIPYDAGLWGASLFWDLFNRNYDAYSEARGRYEGSLAQAGTSGYESGGAAIVLTCGGAAACATIDSELGLIQPYQSDLSGLLRDLHGVVTIDDPIDNEEIREVLQIKTGRDWSAFFRDYIEGVQQIPASSFSSLNIVESQNTSLPAETPEVTTSTSGWILLVVAIVLVFIIPFVLEPYTMKPRKPGFLQKKLEED